MTESRNTPPWGKFHRDSATGVTRRHPLIHHCADVAACFQALMAEPVIAARLAKLGGVETLTPVQRDRLAVLAALHDTGKFNIGFQNKIEDKPPFTTGHVQPLLAMMGTDYAETGRLVEALQWERLACWARDEFTVYALIVAAFAHHGRPVNCGTGFLPALWQPKRCNGALYDPLAGVAELRAATERWFPAAWRDGGEPLPAKPELVHAFNGLLTLADWLGSDERFFPFSDVSPSADRMAMAREAAVAALATMGLDTRGGRESLNRDTPAFAAISEHSPRAAQRQVCDLPIDPGGSITILEAKTGDGKTEAALARFVALFGAEFVSGMYFALPTRTAATQIHARVTAAVARAFPDAARRPPVVLAVPGYIRVDARDGRKLAPFEVLWNDDRNERFAHRAWAAEHPKRYLAGAIVVGTIDQVLLSTLQVSHAHLRGAALLRHLLVIDEVHASDAYMTRLTETVLQRHLSAGGHALLLSATLGGEARAALLFPGARRPGPALETALADPFPLVEHRAAGQADVRREEPGQDQQLRFTVEPWPAAGEPRQVAARALEAAAAGAKVLVLRNTVGDCVATQAALEDLAGDGANLLFRCQGVYAPHHSRFARADRDALDGAIEHWYGKNSRKNEPGGCVVVATQTVQQSLDLDADLMLTDLCPMDVLLQRMGRVHRHGNNPRPIGYERPHVVVLVPAERDLAQALDARGQARLAHGLGTVYDDLRVIEATWRLLEANPHIELPRDSRRLVEGAVHSAELRRVAREGGPHFQKHEQVVMGKLSAQTLQAALNLLTWAKPFPPLEDTPLFPARGRDGQAMKDIKTRLGEQDRHVSLPERPRGPFGADIDAVTVPGWMAHEIPEDATVDVRPGQEDGRAGLYLTLGPTMFFYDRWGLKRV